MKNFSKLLTCKIISIILVVAFSVTSVCYGIDLPSKSHLRTPLMGDSEEGQRRLREGLAAMLNLQGLTPEQHRLLNNALGTFFTGLNQVRDDIGVLTDEELARIDPEGNLRKVTDLKVYRFTRAQLEEALQSVWAYPRVIAYITANLIAHPGRFRDEQGKPRATNLFILDEHYSLLTQLEPNLQAQWARHERTHLDDIARPEEDIQRDYPLNDVVAALQEQSKTAGITWKSAGGRLDGYRIIIHEVLEDGRARIEMIAPEDKSGGAIRRVGVVISEDDFGKLKADLHNHANGTYEGSYGLMAANAFRERFRGYADTIRPPTAAQASATDKPAPGFGPRTYAIGDIGLPPDIGQEPEPAQVARGGKELAATSSVNNPKEDLIDLGRRLRRLIDLTKPRARIYIVGKHGAGKSTLRKAIKSALLSAGIEWHEFPNLIDTIEWPADSFEGLPPIKDDMERALLVGITRERDDEIGTVPSGWLVVHNDPNIVSKDDMHMYILQGYKEQEQSKAEGLAEGEGVSATTGTRQGEIAAGEAGYGSGADGGVTMGDGLSSAAAKDEQTDLSLTEERSKRFSLVTGVEMQEILDRNHPYFAIYVRAIIVERDKIDVYWYLCDSDYSYPHTFAETVEDKQPSVIFDGVYRLDKSDKESMELLRRVVTHARIHVLYRLLTKEEQDRVVDAFENDLGKERIIQLYESMKELYTKDFFIISDIVNEEYNIGSRSNPEWGFKSLRVIRLGEGRFLNLHRLLDEFLAMNSEGIEFCPIVDFNILETISAENLAMLEELGFFNNTDAAVVLEKITQAINIPTTSSARTLGRGSVLGLMKTLAREGHPKDATFTISKIKDKREYEDDQGNPLDKKYSESTLRRELRDAEDIGLIRRTGKEGKEDVYVVLADITLDKLEKLRLDPHKVLREQLDRGRIKAKERADIRKGMHGIGAELDSVPQKRTVEIGSWDEPAVKEGMSKIIVWAAESVMRGFLGFLYRIGNPSPMVSCGFLYRIRNPSPICPRIELQSVPT